VVFFRRAFLAVSCDGDDGGHVLLTIGQLVEPLTGRHWDAPATTREVAARSARFQRRGLRPGDRVFLHTGNRLEFFAELPASCRRISRGRRTTR
jgi:hypothetical protein